jgi:prophage maintenance system killer protein
VAAAVVFLKLNGVSRRRNEPGIERLAWDIASGAASRDDAVAYFVGHIEALD